MPANLAIITLFLLPERITQAQFFASLTTFTFGNWMPDPALKCPWVPSPIHPAFDPMDAEITFDLQSLYVAVLAMGGYHSVERSQRWIIIGMNMNLWPEEFHLPREFYRRYLLFYELYSRRVRRLFTARKRYDRDPNEYSQQSYIRGQENNDREDYHVACRQWSSIDVRLEMERQGVLDGGLVLAEYYTISPAIQLYVTQKTYMDAPDIFENYARIGMVHFERPKSIGPFSSISKDEDHCEDPSDDSNLSEECKFRKYIMISRNRMHIFETQVRRDPEPLPIVTSEELAKFMYDEVDSDSDSDDDEDSECDEKSELKELPQDMDPEQARLVEKFGFGYRSQRKKPKVKKEKKPAMIETNREVNGLTLAEFLDKNPFATPADSPAWKMELQAKFGIKPKVYGPEPSTEVAVQGPNFEQYLHSHGHDAPEIKRFFDDRLKLEGGFWQMELDRLDALERRVRGDDERADQLTHPQWDKVSADSVATPGGCHSGETPDSSEPEAELFRVVAPPPGFGDMPTSMHEYSQRVALQRKVAEQWNVVAHPGNNSGQRGATFKPPPEENGIKLSMLPRSPEEQRFQLDSYGGEFERLRDQYSQHEKAVSDLLGSDTYDEPGVYCDASAFRSSKVNLAKPSDDDSRKILSLPTGQRVDITEVNPGNPPSYNYAQQWLQKRAEDEEDEDVAQQMNTPRRNENTAINTGTRRVRGVLDEYHSYLAGDGKILDRYNSYRDSTPEPLFNTGAQKIIDNYQLTKVPTTPMRPNVAPTRIPGTPMAYTTPGQKISYNPTSDGQQHPGMANQLEIKLKLTPSEDLLLSNAFYKYQVEHQDDGEDDWECY